MSLSNTCVCEGAALLSLNSHHPPTKCHPVHWRVRGCTPAVKLKGKNTVCVCKRRRVSIRGLRCTNVRTRLLLGQFRHGRHAHVRAQKQAGLRRALRCIWVKSRVWPHRGNQLEEGWHDSLTCSLGLAQLLTPPPSHIGSSFPSFSWPPMTQAPPPLASSRSPDFTFFAPAFCFRSEPKKLFVPAPCPAHHPCPPLQGPPSPWAPAGTPRSRRPSPPAQCGTPRPGSCAGSPHG